MFGGIQFLEITENNEKKERIERSLRDYFQINNNHKLARFKLAKLIDAFDSSESLESADMGDLWTEHHRLLKELNRLFVKEKEVIDSVSFLPEYKIDNKKITSNNSPNFSLLDLKIKIAEKIFKECRFCEKRCMVDRNTERGDCLVKDPRISSEFLHIGEEAPLVPSHTIFFTGCNFNCVFCQNWEISQKRDAGIYLSKDKLARIIEDRHRKGSKNVNFVGGEPTPNLLFILSSMALCKENIPVVWNSNFYMSKETMELLNGFVDLYLTDFKFGNNECAIRLAGVKDYCEIVTRNHLMAKKSGDLIIRHLVLPDHVECCSKPILKWIAENLGKDTIINIMDQYRPLYKASRYEEISRLPYRSEINQVIEYARKQGLKNII